jgi:hypothetical protein
MVYSLFTYSKHAEQIDHVKKKGKATKVSTMYPEVGPMLKALSAPASSLPLVDMGPI